MSEAPKTKPLQFGVTDLLIATAAVGLWLTLLAATTGTVRARFVAVMLFSFTLAAGGLLHGRRHAWPVAALLAPLIGAIVLAAGIVLENLQ